MSVAYDFSGVYNSLSDDAVRALDALGINSADANSLSKLSFEGVMGQLLKMTGESFSHPMKGLVTIIAVLILCAMLSAYKSIALSELRCGSACGVVYLLGGKCNYALRQPVFSLHTPCFGYDGGIRQSFRIGRV